MADKQGLLGARSAESDDGGPGSGRGDREAYEEDWYRSLRALAERQQQATGKEDEQPAEEPPADRVQETETPHEEPGVETASGGAEPEDDETQSGATSFPEAPERPETWPTERREPHLQLVTEPSHDESAEAETDVDDRSSAVDGWIAAETPADAEVAPPLEVGNAGTVTDLPGGAEGPSVFAGIAELTEDLRAADAPFEAVAEQDAARETAPESATEAAGGDLEAPAEPGTAEPAADVAVSQPSPDEMPDELGSWPSDLPAASPGPADEPVAPDRDAPDEMPDVAEAPAEAPAPSLTSTDPHERRVALEALASHDLSDADTHRIEALLLDPETDVRLLALHTLARRPDRVQDDAIW